MRVSEPRAHIQDGTTPFTHLPVAFVKAQLQEVFELRTGQSQTMKSSVCIDVEKRIPIPVCVGGQLAYVGERTAARLVSSEWSHDQ